MSYIYDIFLRFILFLLVIVKLKWRFVRRTEFRIAYLSYTHFFKSVIQKMILCLQCRFTPTLKTMYATTQILVYARLLVYLCLTEGRRL